MFSSSKTCRRRLQDTRKRGSEIKRHTRGTTWPREICRVFRGEKFARGTHRATVARFFSSWSPVRRPYHGSDIYWTFLILRRDSGFNFRCVLHCRRIGYIQLGPKVFGHPGVSHLDLLPRFRRSLLALLAKKKKKNETQA